MSGRLFGGGEATGEGVEAANAAGLVGGSRKLFPLPHSHNFGETVRHVAGVDLQSTKEASPAIPHGPITAEDHLANYLSRDYDLLHRPEPAQLESTFGAAGATFSSSYSVCYGIVQINVFMDNYEKYSLSILDSFTDSSALTLRRERKRSVFA